ncbi:uncharacterized protein LOC134766270 [Penaeus indicus]|uniref:uncharacterized protein LOC134766270 n=1 Tax=Penaeus indicus TaxID=29960 RepID=UPI00300D235F
MLGGLLAAAVLALAGLACAHPDGDALDVGVGVSKRDLEFNQYVPGYRLRGEPSCEELRAMWRLSKREARRATSTNQLPRARPYTYGRLIAFAPDPNAGPSAPVYGRIWKGRYPPFAKSSSSQVPVKGSFEKLKIMLMDSGGSPRGQFDTLRSMMAMERGPGVSSKGRLKELIGLSASERREQRPVALALRAVEESYKPSVMSRREPPPPPPVDMSPRTMRGSTHFSQQGFVGPLLPGDSRVSGGAPWQPPAPNPSLRACGDVTGSYCRVNSDCACEGLYRCNKGRCKATSAVKDNLGWWSPEPLPSQDLGIHKWARTPPRPAAINEEDLGRRGWTRRQP